MSWAGVGKGGCLGLEYPRGGGGIAKCNLHKIIFMLSIMNFPKPGKFVKIICMHIIFEQTHFMVHI